jgi:predicted NUDIX family NTP pyrophosphohydrolase
MAGHPSSRLVKGRLINRVEARTGVESGRSERDHENATVSMPRLSAGILMYRSQMGQLQVFLAHPGGPFYARKDEGHWTIPKGEPDPDEELLNAAKREFEEETGIVPTGPFIPLTPVKQKGGKIVHAWAFEGDWEGRSSATRLAWNGHRSRGGKWSSRISTGPSSLMCR